MQKILIISANSGNFDAEREQVHAAQLMSEDLTAVEVIFNDKNFPARNNSLHPRLQAKIPKMLGWEYFPGYDYYIWIDGSILMNKTDTINFMINSCNNSDMVLFNHPERSSILEEVNFVENEISNGSEYLSKRYSNEFMREQVTEYLNDKSFTDSNLYLGGFFLYTGKLTREKPEFFRDWFYNCARYSVQDQLSLPYLIHKHKVKINNNNSKIGFDYFKWLVNNRTRIA